MAKNFVWKDADYLSAPVPTGTKSGTPLRLGGLNAITQTDEGSLEIARANAVAPNYMTANGASSNKAGYASVAYKGAARVEVSGAIATYGLPVYIDPADNKLHATDNSGARVLFGHALGVKAAGAGDIIVRIAN